VRKEQRFALARMRSTDATRRGKKVSPVRGVKTAGIVESSKQVLQTQPTPEQIRHRAYEIYVSRNGTPGDEVQDWLQAEHELSPEQPCTIVELAQPDEACIHSNQG
jgi:hypothetical protein